MKWIFVWEFPILLAAPVGNMKRILCSNWPPKWARWAHLARRRFLALIQRKKKNYLEHTDKFLNVWTITAIESQKAANDSKKKRKHEDKLKRLSTNTVSLLSSLSKLIRVDF